MTSEVYGLRKNSPTVGCYFFSDDYLKFIERLKFYVGGKNHDGKSSYVRV